MPLKIPRRKLLAEFVCSENEISKSVESFFNDLKKGDWLFLEGEMGAGKSTFARVLLNHAFSKKAFQGSPTFPLVHEYRFDPRGLEWLHMDLYRLKTEDELYHSGVESYFNERKEAIILVEWLSQFPEFKKGLYRAASSSHRIFEIDISIENQSDDLRRFTISKRP